MQSVFPSIHDLRHPLRSEASSRPILELITCKQEGRTNIEIDILGETWDTGHTSSPETQHDDELIS